MSEMGGVDAGPLYVNVVADTSGFGRDLQAKVNAETARVKATITAEVNTSKAEADLAKTAAKERVAQIKAEAQVDRAEADLATAAAKKRVAEIKAQANVRDAEIELAKTAAKERVAQIRAEAQVARADADLTAAAMKQRTARIDAEANLAKAEADLTRAEAKRRVAEITAEANVLEADRKLAEAARRRTATIDVDVRTDKIDAFGQKLQGLGTSGLGLLQFPAIAAGISMAVGALAQLVAGLASVVAAAAPAVGILAAIPGAVAGAAQGIGTVISGFAGIGAALKASDAAQKSSGATAGATAAQHAAAAARVVAAQEQVKQAVASAANTEANAARAVQQAQQGVANAHAEAARSIESAQRGLATAQTETARQIQSAEQAVVTAHQEAARQIAQAEQQLAQAQRDATQAQLDLIQARADATRQLQDMNNNLVDASFSVEEAQIGVQRADINRTKVDQNPKSTALDKQQADLDYREAVQRLKEQQLQQQRLKADTDKANKAGVEGSDLVTKAKQRVLDANEKVRQSEIAIQTARAQGAANITKAEQALQAERIQGAQRIGAAEQALQDARAQGAQKIADAESNLANTRRTSAFSVASAQNQVLTAQRALTAAQAAGTTATSKQSAASTALTNALAGLSPAGRGFVTFLVSTLIPAWHRVQNATQDALLPPVQRGLTALMPLLGILQTGMVRTATILGGAFQSLATQYLATPIFKRDLATVMATNNRAFATLGTALIPLARALTDITVASGPLLQRFAQFIATSAQMVGGFISAQRAGGGLTRFFQTAGDTAAQLWRIVRDLAVAIFNIGKAAYPAGQVLLASFEGVVAKFRAWTGSMQGQNTLRDYFFRSIPIVQSLGRLINEIVIDFFKLGNNNSFAGLIDTIRTVALPAILRLGQTLNGAFGPALVRTITDVVNLIADLAGGGGGGALASFVNTLDRVVRIFDAIARNPIGGFFLRLAASVAGTGLALSLLLGPLVRFGALALKVGEFAGGFIQFARTAEVAEKGIAKIGGTIAEKVIPWVARLGTLFLASGPWGWIILGIAAVVTGLVLAYTHFQGFHDFVNRALRDVGNAALWLWRNAFVPAFNGIQAALGWIGPRVFDGIKTAISAVGTAAMWLWRSVFVPVFNGIGVVVSWWWNNVTKPILTALVNFFRQVIAPAATWLWREVFVAAFNGIAGTVRDSWNAIRVVLNGLGAFFRAVVAPVVAWLWHNVFGPYFQGIALVVRTEISVVTTILRALWTFLRTVVGPVISWLWHNVVAPAFQGIGQTIKLAVALVTGIINGLNLLFRRVIGPTINWLWQNVVKPNFAFILGGIKSAIATVTTIMNGINRLWRTVIGPTVMWLWNNVVKPAFNGIASIIQTVWSRGISPAFEAIKRGLTLVGDAFKSAVGLIGRLWDGLRRATGTPVNFVLGTVYNNGIKKVWDWVASKVGASPLPAATLLKFARGGVVPGYAPGQDTEHAILSPGEGVLVPEAVRGIARQLGTSAENAVAAINASFAPRLGNIARHLPRAAASAANALVAPGEGVLVPEAVRGLARAAGTNANRAIYEVNAAYSPRVRAAINPADLGQTIPGQVGRGRQAFGLGGAFSWIVDKVSAGASAVKNTVGSAIGGVKDAIAGALGSALSAAGGGLKKIIAGVLPSTPPFTGLMRSMSDTLVDKATGWLTQKDQAQNSVAAGGGGNAIFGTRVPNVGVGVERWRALVVKALAAQGLSTGLADKVLRQMQTESGGNPNAVQGNIGDINNRTGDLAKGFMQVIGATFRAYHWPGTSNNIFDPWANLMAALNYAKHRYGPSLSFLGQGHGYSLGGLVERVASSPAVGGLIGKAASLFDSGGILNPGTTLVQNATGHPEYILTGPQWDAVSGLAASAASDRAVLHEPSAAERLRGAQIQIDVHPQPGTDAREVAREVAVELGWLMR